MLERHQDAPDTLEIQNPVPPLEINWELLRDAPLIDLNGIIDWNQLTRERLLGVDVEDIAEDDDDDSGSECSNDNEDSFYDQNDNELVYDYFMDHEFDTIEWSADEPGNEEFMNMLDVD